MTEGTGAPAPGILPRWGWWTFGAHVALVLAGAAMTVALASSGWGRALAPTVEGLPLVDPRWLVGAWVVAGFTAAVAGWTAALGGIRGLRAVAILVGVGTLLTLAAQAGAPDSPIPGMGPPTWAAPLAACTLAYAAVGVALRTGFGRVGIPLVTAGVVGLWGMLMWLSGGSVASSAPAGRPGPAMLLAFVIAVAGLSLLAWRLAAPRRTVLERQRLPPLLYISHAAWPVALAAGAGRPLLAVLGAAGTALSLALVLGPWPDRFMAWRDRTLADPAFQRSAGAIPLVRGVAVRRARKVFDLCSGFVFSQTLLACLRLDLFDELSRGPRTAAELARDWSLPEPSALRLLEAAEVLDLVQRRRGGRWGLGKLGAPLVGNDAVRTMAEHNVLLYRDMEDPVALLREPGGARTSVGRYWPYAWSENPSHLSEEQVAHYSELMTRSHGLVADEVLARYPFRRHRRHLDVGAGEAAFAERVATLHQHLEVTAFDLPGVAERARARLDANGSGARLTVVGGDFLTDPLPKGMDVVTLLRVIHDHDDQAVLSLLKNAREALEPGGRLVVAEPMAGTVGSERVGSAYFSWYLHAMGAGRARTPAELERLLRTAGFRRIRLLTSRVPVQTGLLIARR